MCKCSILSSQFTGLPVGNRKGTLLFCVHVPQEYLQGSLEPNGTLHLVHPWDWMCRWMGTFACNAPFGLLDHQDSNRHLREKSYAIVALDAQWQGKRTSATIVRVLLWFHMAPFTNPSHLLFESHIVFRSRAWLACTRESKHTLCCASSLLCNIQYLNESRHRWWPIAETRA